MDQQETWHKCLSCPCRRQVGAKALFPVILLGVGGILGDIYLTPTAFLLNAFDDGLWMCGGNSSSWHCDYCWKVCKGNFGVPKEVHGWSKLGFPSTQPEGTKGPDAFSEHVDFVHISSKWMNHRRPSQPSPLLIHS